MVEWKKLLACVVGCELAGSAGSAFTAPAIPVWYASLAKSQLNPPAWVFAPAWTILFALMGAALYLVWQSKKEKRRALALFAVQFALNVAWSFLFFGLRDPALAFAEIILLWLAIALTLREFWKIDRRAGWLLVPYLAWVSFAAFLNYSVWVLNA